MKKTLLKSIALLFFTSIMLNGCSTATVDVNNYSNHASLELPNRLAFMSGHVQAGLALYRAGEPQMAAPHLLHPVSETHKAERVGLDDLGFNGELFEAVSKALNEGRSASDIEAQLQSAEINLDLVMLRAGGDSRKIIDFLMDKVLEEYAIGVTNGKVTDMGEYQDAFGFTVVAIGHASNLQNDELLIGLEDLLSMWPASPVPNNDPVSFFEIEKRVAKIKKLL